MPPCGNGRVLVTRPSQPPRHAGRRWGAARGAARRTAGSRSAAAPAARSGEGGQRRRAIDDHRVGHGVVARPARVTTHQPAARMLRYQLRRLAEGQRHHEPAGGGGPDSQRAWRSCWPVRRPRWWITRAPAGLKPPANRSTSGLTTRATDRISRRARGPRRRVFGTGACRSCPADMANLRVQGSIVRCRELGRVGDQVQLGDPAAHDGEPDHRDRVVVGAEQGTGLAVDQHRPGQVHEPRRGAEDTPRPPRPDPASGGCGGADRAEIQRGRPHRGRGPAPAPRSRRPAPPPGRRRRPGAAARRRGPAAGRPAPAAGPAGELAGPSPGCGP